MPNFCGNCGAPAQGGTFCAMCGATLVGDSGSGAGSPQGTPPPAAPAPAGSEPPSGADPDEADRTRIRGQEAPRVLPPPPPQMQPGAPAPGPAPGYPPPGYAVPPPRQSAPRANPFLGWPVSDYVLAGVAERSVPKIVRERDRLRQVLVQPQRTRNRARGLRDFNRVGQARAEVVAAPVQEDLRFVLKATEGRAVNHPVAVALEARAVRVLVFGAATPLRFTRFHGKRRECFEFPVFYGCSIVHDR